ncbi:ExeM/NucH family extracellular endonuclease [Demequina mangrovi]|uniref:ExeM/NucH family extracellular endonuclease n=1 Tax=Demequina mangrovi TaxID=1043493 RepID=UPI00115FEBA6|nr:ExeM/NucH family extracellular endonuclease [Demequina mangrovi]
MTITPPKGLYRAGAASLLGALSVSVLAAVPAVADVAITDLLISEYVEGSNSNKAYELYNGTTDEIPLAGYSVELYANGATSPNNTLTFSDETIAAGATLVVYNSSAWTEFKIAGGISSTTTYYNGDDALVLKYGATVVDSIGQVGTDPGSSWAVGTAGATGEHTLVRDAAVCEGDTDATDAYAPTDDDWDVHPQNTSAYLGSHTTTCAAGAYVPAEAGEEPVEEVVVTPISAVQGSGSASPLAGSTVTITGVVVGDYQGVSGDYQLSGYFVQSLAGDEDGDDATSEGVFVYDYRNAVSVGDVVTVTGLVNEYYGLTQIKSVSSVEIEGTATVEPAAAALPQATEDQLERVEGMLVTFAQELTVSDVYDLFNFGEATLSANGRLMNPTSVAEPGEDANAVADANALNMLVLDDASAKTYDDIEEIPYGIGGEPTTADNPLRAGSTVEGLTGVVGYGYNDWRLYSNGSLAAAGEDNTAAFVDANARPTSAPAVGGDLTVASFNMLNFFETLGYGEPYCGPTADSDCRGASTEDEYALQLGKHVETVTMLDADVVGLMEVENTVDVEALDGLVAAVNEELGSERYAVLDTGLIGTDVIKVGLIYDQTTVAPTGDFAILDSSVDPNFDDTLSRPALAQTFTELASGESFTAIVNHLKSKNCYSSATGGDLDLEDGAGCYNTSRTSAAEALVEWANADPTGTGEDRTLMIGDYNAYEKEDPIDAILAGGYTSLVSGDDYSYVYYAAWGQLDYAFASAALVDHVTGAEHLHINADEVSDLQYYGDLAAWEEGTAYRSSDHDPVLVGLTLAAEEAEGGTIDDAEGTSGDEATAGGATLTVSDGSITAFARYEESELSVQDPDHSFPVGLFGFRIAELAEGASVEVTIALDDLYDTESWVLRKLIGGTYVDGPEVEFGVAGGVTTMTFVLTDGGAFDADGEANGVIVDPVGPAVADSDDDLLAATGADGVEGRLAGTLALVLAGAALVTGARRRFTLG